MKNVYELFFSIVDKKNTKAKEFFNIQTFVNCNFFFSFLVYLDIEQIKIDNSMMI